MGGPGCGKGTTCERLCACDLALFHGEKRIRFRQLCAGDLLRGVASGSVQGIDTEVAAKVQNLLKAGAIVPSEITFALMRDALKELEKSSHEHARNIYLLDGYPRKRDQGDWFENEFGKASMVLHLECSSDVLRKRLAKRFTETCGDRCDDIPSLIEKRINVHVEEVFPVIESYKREGRLRTIQCDGKTIEEVTEDAQAAILEILSWE
eukprot:CAMPEP_0201514740 /NCGR_PEP_ID=MMETSP0161_2-20130828/6495_1 /ASSEMBLY_ACC=CAM_ASM_000251 /TAXON_ID=180227 /ORGANISM="Neoparamoeba aestuarina, Strain SoJaBio B1-5/56/2" /LENGTH=207 /DNA_ID=CAMNT_0047911375 /DNA_START=85 /DNA_END=708 /DNA_ORIENTATION=+